MRKPLRQRNDEQRKRQQAYRERLKAERRPGRDDIARVLLHWFVVESTKDDSLKRRLEAIEDTIVACLVDHGFDERASYAVFDTLVERYTREGWGFRRKAHLAGDNVFGAADVRSGDDEAGER